MPRVARGCSYAGSRVVFAVGINPRRESVSESVGMSLPSNFQHHLRLMWVAILHSSAPPLNKQRWQAEGWAWLSYNETATWSGKAV